MIPRSTFLWYLLHVRAQHLPLVAVMVFVILIVVNLFCLSHATSKSHRERRRWLADNCKKWNVCVDLNWLSTSINLIQWLTGGVSVR